MDRPKYELTRTFVCNFGNSFEDRVTYPQYVCFFNFLVVIRLYELMGRIDWLNISYGEWTLLSYSINVNACQVGWVMPSVLRFQ